MAKEEEFIDIFSFPKRPLEIDKLTYSDVVSASWEILKRIKINKSRILFFPETGALPLMRCFRYYQKNNLLSSEISFFSSKITARIKSPISKQICGLLTDKERALHLKTSQIKFLRREFRRLPNLIKNKINFGALIKLRMDKIVNEIAEIGLYIPSEDQNKWHSSGLLKKGFNKINNNEFQSFRTNLINLIIRDIDNIIHPTRRLLNIVLAQTKFAKIPRKSNIYVIDEAISRGRSLNAMEIIFKSFNPDTRWQIGVLYCPTRNKEIDYIFSHDKPSPFSNRTDLIGNFIVETSTAFTNYSFNKLKYGTKTKINKNKINKYLNKLNLYINKKFKNILQQENNEFVVDLGDIVRLLHFAFVEADDKIIKKCIDLNPYKCSGLIEEAAFYLNMPHPFGQISFRNWYKQKMRQSLRLINDKNDKGFIGIRKEFLSIRKMYNYQQITRWQKSCGTYFGNCEKIKFQRNLC